MILLFAALLFLLVQSELLFSGSHFFLFDLLLASVDQLHKHPAGRAAILARVLGSVGQQEDAEVHLTVQCGNMEGSVALIVALIDVVIVL